jgi:hypothetical protein
MTREGFYKVVIAVALTFCLPTIVIAGMRMGMGGGMGIRSQQPISFTSTASIVGQTPYYYYEDPVSCGGGGMGMMCHNDKFQQWQTSQHSRAWTGDFMVAQYYDLARPDGDLDQKVAGIKVGCVGCHSPSAYMTYGDNLLNMAPPRPAGTENAWNMLPGATRREADRGVFCDFCHTVSAVGTPPSGFNYTSAATASVDPKRGPMMMGGHGRMGMGTHDRIYSPLHDDPKLCGSCHDEVDPFGKLVKGTYTEWVNSPYNPATRCQDCHQRDGVMGGMGGRGCMMGMYSMNFKGGFSPWIEGVVSLGINAPASAPAGQKVDFTITLTNDKVGHEFPSGSEEERQLWLYVTASDEAGHSWHVPVTTTPNETDPSDANHIYWVTTNAAVAWPSPNLASGAIARDALPEGDRIYHSIFISPAYAGSKITYAQYYAEQIYSNRLMPRKPRVENYSWSIPQSATGSITFRAVLNYRRMPDSMADYLGIMRRPIVQVNSASAIVNLR